MEWKKVISLKNHKHSHAHNFFVFAKLKNSPLLLHSGGTFIVHNKRLDLKMYNQLINAYTAQREVLEALTAFECMIEDGVEPDEMTLNLIVDA